MAAEAAIRKAVAADIAAIDAITQAAYEIYIDRIGKPPEPMGLDVSGQIAQGEIHVLETGDGIAGYIITYQQGGSQLIENIAVAPQFQGQGLGARLMQFAEQEAKRNSLSQLSLYTNVAMTENLGYYSRLGYKEYKRALHKGFERAFFEKRLLS
jgi:ribosomal protein S18 acetylase RimI-like enzyme